MTAAHGLTKEPFVFAREIFGVDVVDVKHINAGETQPLEAVFDRSHDAFNVSLSDAEVASYLHSNSVREVLTVSADQLDEATLTDDDAVTGIAKLGERLVVMLDAPAALQGAGL